MNRYQSQAINLSWVIFLPFVLIDICFLRNFSKENSKKWLKYETA